MSAIPLPRPSPSGLDLQDPTTGAWSEEAFDRAVAKPVSAWARQGRIEGDRRFETLLGTVGQDHTERTRLLTAYGMAIFARDEKAASLPYLKRAATEARSAFTPNSRQLAMALADYATVEFEVLGDDVTPEAEQMTREAYGIRMRILGLHHDETRSSRGTLSRIEELPSRIRGNAEKLAVVSRRYEALLASTSGRLLEPWEAESLQDQWIDMLIANRRPDLACAALVSLQSGPGRAGSPWLGRVIGQKLQDAGYTRQAEPLLGAEPDLDILKDTNIPPPVVRCAP